MTTLAFTAEQALLDEVESSLAALADADVVARIAARDHTVWQEDPTEVANRLGWLDAPAAGLDALDALDAMRERAVADGMTQALVLGMGGSSLFPEVCARAIGRKPGGLELAVCDTTDPAAILRLTERHDTDTTLFLPASKSGATIETRAQLRWFWDRTTSRRGVEAGTQFITITDPGSALANLSHARLFRHVWQNNPDIGGRFSALSFFGLVPAALLGADLRAMLTGAQVEAEASTNPDPTVNLGLRLGVALAAAAANGRDKCTVLLPDELAPLGVWIEQLVAESTGKHGKGIIPVVDEIRRPTYGDDRLFVAVRRDGILPAGITQLRRDGHPVVVIDELPESTEGALGALVQIWEYATAIAGHCMGINPFDQPDVESAKASAGEALDAGEPDIPFSTESDLLDLVNTGDLVAITGFVDPEGEDVDRLHALAGRIVDTTGAAVTIGVGPRYLHSTGQLHKGYADRCVVVQLVGEDPQDCRPKGKVRGRAFSFGQLKRAQAAGDFAALTAAGARVVRLDIRALPTALR